MPITNQRAADGRCGVRRSDVILLILCRARSTCVHAALLTALLLSSPPFLSCSPFLRGEISVKGRTVIRGVATRDSGREADSRWRETRARCSKTSRAIVTVILTPCPFLSRPPRSWRDHAGLPRRARASNTETRGSDSIWTASKEEDYFVCFNWA